MKSLVLLCVGLGLSMVPGATGTVAFTAEHGVSDFFPRVSPDGTRVAFLRQGITPHRLVRSPSLYVVDADKRLLALTQGAAESSSNAEAGHYDAVTGVSWAPDGRHLVFVHQYRATRYDDNRSELVVAAADGSESRALPQAVETYSSPAWSPNGDEILFAGSLPIPPGDGLWVVHPDGTGLRQLVRGGGDPAWSPDGTKIAYVDGGAVLVAKADGSDPAAVTASMSAASPAWSPDGSRIAFDAAAGGNRDVYVVASTGGAPSRTTTREALDVMPEWTRDGASILFASTLGRGQYVTTRGYTYASFDLWMMSADGSGQRRLLRQPPKAANGRGCTIIGTAVREALAGTPRGDVLCGFASNDKIAGRGGNDVLDGGAGNDRLDAAAGDDFILARDGLRDTVSGGPGIDRAEIDRGRDVVRGVEKVER
jgi:Tol biopolymer transport system component